MSMGRGRFAVWMTSGDRLNSECCGVGVRVGGGAVQLRVRSQTREINVRD
ncbi:hypothetical protein RR48_06512 [Papilio machaon]|uniref:Uncharacterized protein n=1 Tax=Papilio machaon TaxID=76193 RepID=A0A194RQ84_PAPMA|nr:hypothetical protein RR48_06512 [Papilio machaon]